MKRLIVVLVAAAVAVLALGVTAVAVVGDDEPRPGPSAGPRMMGDRMMGGWMMDGRRPRDRMMSGSMMGAMHGVRVTSERRWLTEMVAHHEEAVTAARELDRSDRPEMRELGRAIVETQSAQIEQMNGWLEEWYGGPAAGVDYRPMMRDLSRLSGDRLDEVFLQDMIPHHMMAVMMSQQLLLRGVAENAEVADLARKIRDDQHAEIFLMQEWLAEWSGR